MKLLRTILRGVAQVVLQPSALTGAFMIAGLAVAAPIFAIAGLLGAAAGTLVARAARFPASQIDEGLYGFNATLVAIGVLVFHPLTAATALAAAAGVVLATVLTRLFIRAGLPPFTLPFTLTLWLILWLLPNPLQPAAAAAHGGATWWLGTLQGVSQVAVVAHPATGLLFLVGIALHSTHSALLSALAALLGAAIAISLDWPAGHTAAGLYGYNAVLAAIATGLNCRRAASIVAACVATVLLVQVFLAAGWTALTFPFVVCTWASIWIERQLARRGDSARR